MRSPQASRWTLAVIGILGVLGFADATYLTAEHYLQLPVPCSISHGCETVLTSKYATIGPVPISLIGVAYYLTVIFLAAYMLTAERPHRLAARGILCLTAAGFGVSVYLFYLQAFVIRAFCQYCLGSGLVCLFLFMASATLAVRSRK